MNLEDALFNWMQMKIVSDARPDDTAAVDTLLFFETILKEDHQLTSFEASLQDEDFYMISYVIGEETKGKKIDRERSEQLLSDINSNPKYNEQ